MQDGRSSTAYDDSGYAKERSLDVEAEQIAASLPPHMPHEPIAAALAAAYARGVRDEREACAKEAESFICVVFSGYDHAANMRTERVAAAIRSRAGAPQ